MPAPWPLNFGVFYAPFHPVGQDPTLALEYDLERTVELDRLGFDEAWFGEHHSGGYELIGSPEIFIAAAAERTKHIRLGTGVTSLPYHHPWLVADRIMLLDHLTRGRVDLRRRPRRAARPTPTSWASTPSNQRRMMEESLEAILALFRSEEPVSRETDWFKLREGRLQLRPYTWPHPEVAVRGDGVAVGPDDGRQARLVAGVAVDVDGRGLRRHRPGVEHVTEAAAKAGAKEPDRRTWRVLGNMHLAETQGAGDRGLHPRPRGVRRLLRWRRRLRAARQRRRRQAEDAASSSSSSTRRAAAS